MRIRASQNARLISLLITIVVEFTAVIVTVVNVRAVVTTVDYLNTLKVVRAVWVQRRQPGKKTTRSSK